MKKLTICAFFLLVVNFANGKIWLVDNNSPSPQIFTTIQAAIDTASAGDTVMVEGSNSTYSGATLNKSIALIGEGYSGPLGEYATVSSIEIRSSDVFISGFVASFKLNGTNAANNHLNNITIERCGSTGMTFTGMANGGSSNAYMGHITIRNIVQKNGTFNFWDNNFNNRRMQFDSLTIENSIFSSIAFRTAGMVIGMETFILRNNIFIGINTGGWPQTTLFFDQLNSGNVIDAIISNNIFYGANPQGCTGCTFTNNLTYQNGANDTLPGPVNNNIYSQNPLFVNYPGGVFDYNHDYHLSAGSPGVGAGVGGTDIGIYGGYYPFNVGEGPQTPVVDYVNISKSAVPQDSIFYLQFDGRIRK